MDFWQKAVLKTGAVGVIGYLFSLIINHLFSSKIIELFGSEKLFSLSLVLIFVLFIALIQAISKSPKQNDGEKQATKDIQITYKDNAKHEGDNRF